MNFNIKDLNLKLDILEHEIINEGYSKDLKIKIKALDNQYYLLRISKYSEKKLQQITLWNQLKALEINMLKLIEYGSFNQHIFALFTYIEGVDLRSLKDKLTASELIDYGKQAGIILKAIHTIKYNQTINITDQWNQYLNLYINSDARIYNEANYLNVIKENKNFNNLSSSCIVHADFHVGNFIITKDKKLYCIDLEKLRINHPYYDLNRTNFNINFSPLFTKTMFDEYFDNNIPKDFWQYQKLSLIYGTLRNCQWAYDSSPSSIEFMKETAKETFNTYDGFKLDIPKWYTNN